MGPSLIFPKDWLQQSECRRVRAAGDFMHGNRDAVTLVKGAEPKIVPLHAPGRFAWGGAALEVLAPTPDYVPVGEPKNNDSLVMRVQFGERSFVLTGDVERAIEQEIEGGMGHSDVLKVAHHGSKTSSTPALLDSLHPVFALISNGFENSYGHPHPDILARLAERGICVLRTDALGLISIRTDGRRLQVETGKWEHPRTIAAVFSE